MRLRVRYRISWFMVGFTRVLCFGVITIAKVCARLAVQMWDTNRLRTFYESLSRTRKCLIVITVLLVLLLYIWPSWIPLSKPRSSELLLPHRWLAATERPLGPAEYCLEAKLEQFTHGVETFDVIVNHTPLLPLEKNYLPYVGNGYVGTSVATNSQLYIRSGRILSFPVNFYPIVELNVEGITPAVVAFGRNSNLVVIFKCVYSEAYALHLQNGVVHHIRTFHMGEEKCIVATSITYAARHRPSVLVQELRVHNPTDSSVTINIRQIGVSAWTSVTSINQRIKTSRATDVEFTVTDGIIPHTETSHSYIIAIANVKLPETVTVKASTTWTSNAVTVVRYALIKSADNTTQPDSHVKQISQIVRQEMIDVLNVESKVLRFEHTQVWNSLWSSGFGISLSLASGTLNGDKINATMYYVLSQTPSPLSELDRPQAEKLELEKLLYFPDRCYDGHHTLQNEKMWRDFHGLEDVLDAASTWLVTLDKNGCGPMLRAGADGVLQAMILSYGAFKFSNHHLEFGTYPRDLHRDYVYRRINYGNDTHVNVSVRVGEDNKAALYVSLDRNVRPYYACDAGCIDQPVELSREEVKLPVKLTDPFTPILYITDNKRHIEELKLAIHVREIVEAPAHEQHLIVMHKHGHHFGNLPMLFWGTITILIVVFHLFLFKLIYNEYCNSPESLTAPRYHRHGGRYV